MKKRKRKTDCSLEKIERDSTQFLMCQQRKSTMPNNKQIISKSKGRKAVKEERYRSVAISDDTAIYGRVIKALGQRQFRVILPDATKRLVEVTAKIPKKRALINITDIVLLASSGSNYEIQASMDRKTMNVLAKEKRLHPDLLVAETWDSSKKEMILKDDLGIEFDHDSNEEQKDEESENENENEREKDDIDINDI